jgi:hypothetical protein
MSLTARDISPILHGMALMIGIIKYNQVCLKVTEISYHFQGDTVVMYCKISDDSSMIWKLIKYLHLSDKKNNMLGRSYKKLIFCRKLILELTNDSNNVCQHVIPSNFVNGSKVSKSRCLYFAPIWLWGAVWYKIHTKFTCFLTIKSW